ncbi:hypothetical protein PTKIN_Ptkin01aG0093600 [Pterospermum kingtungense]
MSLEKIVKSLATNTLQFQQETKASIQNLNNQVSQIATTINRLEVQSSRKLPSQEGVNPKENVSTIFLRSGKKVENSVKATPEPSKANKEEKVVINEDTLLIMKHLKVSLHHYLNISQYPISLRL